MSDAMQLDARSLLRLITVDDPQLSPDGRFVTWIRTRIVPEEDATVSTLVVQDVSDGGERESVRDVPGLRSPRWSPDGSWIAYLAPHGDRTQLYVVRAEGGEPRRLTALDDTIASFAWSTNGDQFAVVAGVHHGPPEPSRSSVKALRATRLRWKRDGVGLIGDRYDNLGLVPFEPTSRPVVHPRWLVRDRVDVSGVAWSPEGMRVAFTTSHGGAWERDRRSSVRVLDVSEPASVPRAVASFADIRGHDLSWSPDGNALAVCAHDREEIGHYGAQRLWLVDAAGDGRRALTTDADGTLGNAAYTDSGGAGALAPRWLPSGDGLVAVLSRRSTVRLVRIGLDGTIVPLSAADRVVAGFSLAKDGSSAIVVSHRRDRTADLERIAIGTDRAVAESVRITDHGAAVVGSASTLQPRHVVVDDDRGPRLDAWVLMPESRAEERVPVILYCGGGPGGMRSDNLHIEWQVFAAAGYAVVWVNTRGCQGYGDDFCTDILGAWGHGDFTDNLRGLDAVLAEIPQLDPERQAIAGGSYGGYQVAWALGHTHRFRAAVADRVVVDKLAAFGMSDIGPLRAFEFGHQFPWDDPAAYLRQSPLNDIGGATTPTLIVHSAQDHRCTVGQGEALYSALKIQGVDTRLVRFPNESHGLSRGGRPWHRVRRIQEYLDWFERHLGAQRGDI